MARFRWTDDAVRELRRQMNLEKTYEEIGKVLGCTANAARVKAYKLGWSSHGRSTFLQWRRGHKVVWTPEMRARMSEDAKARWQDPEFRARVEPIVAATNREPARRRNVSRAQDRRRGFTVPADKRDEYRRLIEIKNFSAQEAGAILGLIPQQKGASNGSCKA